jgi:hypothetical protein
MTGLDLIFKFDDKKLASSLRDLANRIHNDRTMDVATIKQELARMLRESVVASSHHQR